MSSASTIPYQLRPHKAIERNLFISILKKLDRSSKIDLHEYRYVGFGAPFLEDFKLLHLEFGIVDMDCIEYNYFAFSRQKFNNPYYFVNLHNTSSTEYITEIGFNQKKNQIIWWDFAEPAEFRQQLLDIELTAERVWNLDILKFTFNAQTSSFISSHNLKFESVELNKIIRFLKDDPTYQLYLPDKVTSKDIIDDFSALLRAMAMRAVKRGLSKRTIKVDFNHISSFRYADRQVMTTMTGMICETDEFKKILKESGLEKWEFYQTESLKELIIANEISVPAMTVIERIEIDKKIPSSDFIKLAKELKFFYGENDEENLNLLKGYCKYYKYLPYYSKVTY